MRIAVTTPTGNIGSRVVEQLSEAGADLTLLVRDPAKLPDEVRARATVHEGSLEDTAFVRRATAGADALFLLIPPTFTTDDWTEFQLGIGRAAADAVRANGIRRVVFLSSGGAHRDDMYAVSRLGKVERMLEQAAPNVVSLRAGFFFENFLSAVPTITDHGTIYMTLAPDLSLAMVATRDIGDVAARWLLDAGWSGHHVRAVQGPADATPSDVARAFGRVLGREVRYVQVTEDDARQALRAMGAGEHVADEYPRMFTAFNRHAADREPRTAESTTPTTVEEWAREVLLPLVGEPAPAAAA